MTIQITRVETATAELSTIMIGNRQMTISIYRQIQRSLLSDIMQQIDSGYGRDRFVIDVGRVNLWGWVNIHDDQCQEQKYDHWVETGLQEYGKCDDGSILLTEIHWRKDWPHRHIVFDINGQLGVCAIPTTRQDLDSPIKDAVEWAMRLPQLYMAGLR